MLIERRQKNDIAKDLVQEGEQDTWALSYIDLLLLMVTLFILLLSYQQDAMQQTTTELEAAETAKVQITPSNQAFLDQVYMSHLKDRVTATEERNTIKLAMSDSILFFPADATLSHSGEQVLDELALMLKQRPWHILVEGHTDNQPISTPRYASNWELSSSRATSVTRYLIGRGISPERLSAIGYADTRPITSNNDDIGRGKNRRVALILRAPD